MIALRSPSGAVEAELLPEVGGRIHRLRIDGRDVLRTPGDPSIHAREPLYWGSYPMVPWCNRIPGGVLRFGGRVHRLPAEVDGNAIHGRAVSAPWQDLGGGVLEYRDAGDPAFPFPFTARQEIAVDDAGLTLRLSVRNDGDAGMPAGLGIHPWFAAGDGLAVELPAERVYPSEDNIPIGDPMPVEGDRDLRSGREPRWGLDECWTSLTASRIRLTARDGFALDYGYTAAATHVVLAAIEPLGAIAIEPQTHGVDGHARAERGAEGGIATLSPGATLAVTYTVRRAG